MPAAPDPLADRYRRVRAEGGLLPGEIHVYTSVPGRGVGYRVIAPMALADGRRDPARPRLRPDRGEGRRAADRGRSPSSATSSGRRRATPGPTARSNIWIARDVPLMAEALGTEPVILVVVDGERSRRRRCRCR